MANLSKARIDAAVRFQERAAKKFDTMKNKFLLFSRDFSDIDPKIDDKTAMKMIVKENDDQLHIDISKRKNIIPDYCRGENSRATIEAMFALAHGMTREQLFDESKQGRERKRWMGDKFRSIFNDPENLKDKDGKPIQETKEQKDAREKTAAAEIFKMYDFAMKNCKPGISGDLSDDNNLFTDDFLFEFNVRDPFAFMSQMPNMKPGIQKNLSEQLGIKNTMEFFEQKNAYGLVHSFITVADLRIRFAKDPKSIDAIQNDNNFGRPYSECVNKVFLHDISTAKKFDGMKYDTGKIIVSLAGNPTVYDKDWSLTNYTGSDTLQQKISERLAKDAMPGTKYTYLKVTNMKNVSDADSLITRVDENGLRLTTDEMTKIKDEAKRAFIENAEPGTMVYTGTYGNGEKIDVGKFRNGFDHVDFTPEQQDYAKEKFDQTFDKIFTQESKGMLNDAGLNEFDCIFINGKSVHELYNEKMKLTGPDKDNQANMNMADMRAMVVSAGMFAANNISYAVPEIKDNKLTFGKVGIMSRKEDPFNKMEPLKESVWHKMIHGTESMQDKFDRAAKTDEKAAKDCIDKIRGLSRELKKADEQKAQKAEPVKETAVKKLNISDLAREEFENKENKKKERKEPAKAVLQPETKNKTM